MWRSSTALFRSLKLTITLIVALCLLACVPRTPLTDIATPAPADVATAPSTSDWPIHRHENLGFEVRYPPNWVVDSQEWFVWFFDSSLNTTQSFNIANANFGMKDPEEFLQHLGPPMAFTRTLTLDGQRALFVQLQDVPEAERYNSVVAVVTPYGENLTIGSRCDPILFEQVLSTIHFFKPAFLP